MKVNIVFFGSLREQLGTGQILSELPEGSTQLDLKALLLKNNSNWQALSEDSILCAINHEMATTPTPLNDGDEVAFFPPVTGG